MPTASYMDPTWSNNKLQEVHLHEILTVPSSSAQCGIIFATLLGRLFEHATQRLEISIVEGTFLVGNTHAGVERLRTFLGNLHVEHCHLHVDSPQSLRQWWIVLSIFNPENSRQQQDLLCWRVFLDHPFWIVYDYTTKPLHRENTQIQGSSSKSQAFWDDRGWYSRHSKCIQISFPESLLFS